MTRLRITSVGPNVSVQDLGRPGYLATGLSRGGAADRLALLEAAALLSQPVTAALEMPGFGGQFSADAPVRIALSGAPMKASADGRPLRWNASHTLQAGETLTIGGALRGTYGYLSFGGGLATPSVLNSQSAHLVAGIGRALKAGDLLPLAGDSAAPPLFLPDDDRFGGGTLRVIPGPQTDRFSEAACQALAQSTFIRSSVGNRQGVRLDAEAARFAAVDGLTVLSDLIGPGDIQMTGDGVPYILLSECQTMGGYPRIGTVIPADLPRAAQAAPGATLKFRWVSLEEADTACRPEPLLLADLRRAVKPLIRDPRDISDLLAYHLISGATDGTDT